MGPVTEEPDPRRADAKRRAELAASARLHESSAAQALVDDFVRRAREAGIAPVALEATQLDGRVVRTDKQGWYVTRRKSVAVGTDGSWYVLTVGRTPLARFRTVRLTPSPPPLVVGQGGRDGEGGDLSALLEAVLRQGRP